MGEPEPLVIAFDLNRPDGWPPQPTEPVTARRRGPDSAEVVGVPLFAEGVSVGDLVRIEPGPPGRPDWCAAGPVLRPSRRSTLRVVAADLGALVELQAHPALADCGVRLCPLPPVLAVDVPEDVALEDVLVALDTECSLTLTYRVSSLRHRLTTAEPWSAGRARARRDEEAPAAGGSVGPDVRGRVVWPDEPDFDAARRAWNLAVDQRPNLVVVAADAFDVQATVRFAADRGLRVAPQSTGHGAAALGDLSGAVLLRTRRLRSVDVDPQARSVRVGAGAIWSDVSAALAPYGLAALAGSAGDVGVAGYALGGGYSWLGRRRGLASSSVTAVELVTGDGVFHRVDAQHDHELFWAVRGGGANVGVVTALFAYISYLK